MGWGRSKGEEKRLAPSSLFGMSRSKDTLQETIGYAIETLFIQKAFGMKRTGIFCRRSVKDEG